MKIVVVGLKYFGEKLVQNLNDFDSEHSYIYLDTYASLWQKIKARFIIPRADLVFSINGSLNSSGVFDLCLKNKVPLIMMWVGSDVQQAAQAIASKNARLDYLNYAHHFCEVSWIQKELSDLGIQATIQNFAAFESNKDSQPFLTDKLRVFCYVNDRDPKFYGSEEILLLAKKFPNIDFEIVGTDLKLYTEIPANIHTHGWVKDLNNLYDICQVSLRFPHHDGLATVVLESLARGKQVIYKYPFDCCFAASDFTSLEVHLSKLEEVFNQGLLEENMEGIAFIRKEFNRKKIFGDLIGKFEEINQLVGKEQAK